MKGKLWKKGLSAVTSVMMFAGAVPVQLLAEHAALTASALTKKTVQIGYANYPGSNGNFNHYMPVYNNADYCYTEQIYTADEIGNLGTITGIGWEVTLIASAQGLDIYLVDTDQTDFSAGAIGLENATKVNTGYTNFTSYGYTELYTGTTFTHNPLKNLAVIVVSRTGSPSMLQCATFSSSGTRTIVKGGTSMTTPVAGDTSAGGYSWRNIITLSGYEAEPCSINYNYNHETNTSAIQNVYKNVPLKISPCTDIYPGHEFVEWNTRADGTGTRYAPGSEVTLTSNLTLYAQWKALEGAKDIGSPQDLNEHFPLRSYYNYGYSEQIYTANELGEIGKITGLDFAVFDGVDMDMTFELYLKDVDFDRFTAGAVPLTGATKVFDGTMRFEGGWQHIPFDTAFEHDDSMNLMVIAVNKTGGYMDGLCFNVYGGDLSCTVYEERDSGYLSPDEPEETQYEDYKNVIRIWCSAESYKTIGKASSSSTSNPVNGHSKYGFSEQIYTADEVGDVGTISAIAYNVESSLDHVMNCEIWMQDTDKDGFTGSSDAQPLTGMTKVFDNELNFKYAGWNKIWLNNVFTHDPAKNLLIAFINKTGEASSDYLYMHTYTGSASVGSVYNYGTSTMYINPSPDVYANTSSYKNQIRLFSTDDAIASITYKANGGTGEDYVQRHISGRRVKLAADDIFTRTGYEIVSWNSKADGSGNDYAAGGAVSWQNDVTLYAKWQKKTVIEIGSGDNYSYGFPIAGSSPYGYAETIYSKDEVSTMDSIAAISYRVAYPVDNNLSFEIWMMDTDKDAFISRYDAVSLTGATKVFDGTLNFKTEGWKEITLHSVYTHNTAKNLVIIMINKTGSQAEQSPEFYYYNSEKEETIYDYGSSEEYTTPSNAISGSTTDRKPQIRLRRNTASLASITYKSNGGSGSDIVRKHVSGTQTRLEYGDLIKRTAYDLTGWNTKADGSGNAYAPGTMVSWSDNVTLYAQWTRKTEMTVGQAEDNTNAVPFNTYYSYGWSEQIYTKEEIGDFDKIASISFNVRSVYNYPINCELYLMDTDKTVFATDNEAIPLKNATKVFDGTVNFSEQGWKEIRLDNIYAHNPNKNLMVIAYNKAGSTTQFYTSFYSYEAAGYGTCYYYDSNNITPSPSVVCSRSVYRNQIRLRAPEGSLASITYKANGGTGSDIVRQHIAGNATRIEQLNQIHRSGYLFTGWNTKADGSGNSYTAGTSVSWTSNVTLYAQWTRQYFTEIGSYVSANYSLPIHTNYAYAFSQQLYTADEIGDPGTISSISFIVCSPVNRDITIEMYLADTDKTRFSGSSDLLPVSKATKVFDGKVNFANKGWTEITLDSPFYHEHDRNLIIIVVNKTGVSGGSTYFETYPGTGSLYYSSNSGDCRPSEGGSAYTSSYKNHIIIRNTDAALSSVTYKANGGVGSDVVRKHISGNECKLESASLFTRTGYVIKNWNTKADGSGNTYALDAKVTWSDNVTLYAQWEQLKTITYKANGGIGTDEVQYHKAGETVSLLPNYYFSYKDDACMFCGWNSKADGSGNTYQPWQEVTWTGNVTLYAVWKPTRSIRYEPNGGEGSVSVQYHGAGQKITLKKDNIFSRSGYFIAGWNSKADGTGNTYAPESEVAWTSDVTLYAKWEALKTVTYKPNGGTGSDEVQYHRAGEKISLNDASFTRAGFTFIGWNSKADGTGNTYQPDQEVSWTGNVTLYAMWGSQRIITYKANGGTGSDISQYHVEGMPIELSEPIFDREGYYFGGWNTKADGSGNTYQPGQEVSWKDNVTLYAKWIAPSKITYKANGGIGSEDIIQEHEPGEPDEIWDTDFYRDGYTFFGWNTKADGSGNAYRPGQIVSWTSNVTLYAQWKINRNIIYMANDGSDYFTSSTHGAGMVTTLRSNTFIRSGYVLASWNTKANGTGNTYRPGQSVCWTGNVTLYAQWKPSSTITYIANNGTNDIKMQTHIAGASTWLNNVSTFSYSGYILTGWNTKANGSGNTYLPGSYVEWQNDVTLYAQWKPVKTVLYYKNDGSSSNRTQTHAAGEKFTLWTTTFERDDYLICGWNTKPDGTGNTYAPNTTVAWSDDVVLYAIWKPVKKIIFMANDGTENHHTLKHYAGERARLIDMWGFEREGYVLTGWNTKANGSGNTYQPSSYVTWQNDVTLYAVWKTERTITYYKNDGSGMSDVVSHGAGVKTNLLGADYCSREGYAVTSWNTKADGTGNSYAPGTEVTWTGNVELYAQWKPAKKITYMKNDGYGSWYIQNHVAGVKTALLNDNWFSRSGYTFASWNSKADGSGNTYQPGAEVTWSDNVMLYAQWKQNKSVIYKANGGTGMDDVQVHGAGMKIALYANSFTRSGYTFTGWNTKADGSGNTYAAGKEVSWNDNVTLYAQWKQSKTITYKANGESAPDVVQYHGAGEKVALKPASTFTSSGAFFAGWNTKADGSGNTYQAGQEVSWNDNVTLYAMWRASRTITYKANGGTGSDVVQKHGRGLAVTLKPASTFSRSGYSFAGWNTKADGSGTTYAAGKEVAWNDNVTLYAQWAQNRTITYKANGESAPDVVQYHGAGLKVALKPASTFTSSGAFFAGWNTKADGTGNTYQAGQEVTWTTNVTLYAMWRASRTITYKANGGTGSDVVQKHGRGLAATLKPASTFSKSGYTFVGWNTKADGSGTTYAAGKEVSWNDNVTLYAQWKPTRTITYKANGGTGSDVTQTHAEGEQVALKSNTFTRSGYKFAGWNSKADGSGNTYAAGAKVSWTSNVTLYAKWTKL